MVKLMDDTPQTEQYLWLGVRRGNYEALVPISRELMPVTAAQGSYDIICADAADTVEAGATRPLAPPLSEPLPANRRYTLRDIQDDRIIERLTVGFFKPFKLPSGREAEFAYVRLADAATI